MSDPRTEREKMLTGDLYNAEDPELIALREHARILQDRYNRTNDPAALQRLLGHLGEHTIIRAPFFCDYGQNIRVGSRSFLNFNCVLLDVVAITIGDNTQIGPAVQIYAADHPRDPEPRRHGLENGRSVHIGNNVWIGGGAIILPGITVHDDCVIGAGSVVTRDVPPGATVVGNPGRPR